MLGAEGGGGGGGRGEEGITLIYKVYRYAVAKGMIFKQFSPG